MFLCSNVSYSFEKGTRLGYAPLPIDTTDQLLPTSGSMGTNFASSLHHFNLKQQVTCTYKICYTSLNYFYDKVIFSTRKKKDSFLGQCFLNYKVNTMSHKTKKKRSPTRFCVTSYRRKRGKYIYSKHKKN